MEWTITTQANHHGSCEPIFYNTTLETSFDDIILTVEKREHPHKQYVACCILKVPDKIVYHYFSGSSCICEVEIICGKYLYLRGNGVNNIVDIYTGKILCDKVGYVFDTKYKDKNYIFVKPETFCVEIYDGDFKLINKLLNIYCNDQKTGINKNYIVLTNPQYLQVYDFINNKIVFEDTVCFTFKRWHNNLLFHSNNSHIKVHEIINKDGCSICFEDIKEKYACVPCGHTTTCLNCLKDLTNCPICRTNIESKLKLF